MGNRSNRPEPPAYVPVEPGISDQEKTGALQQEPAVKFPVEPRKNRLGFPDLWGSSLVLILGFRLG